MLARKKFASSKPFIVVVISLQHGCFTGRVKGITMSAARQIPQRDCSITCKFPDVFPDLLDIIMLIGCLSLEDWIQDGG